MHVAAGIGLAAANSQVGSLFILDNGKPVVRRGRKAMGPCTSQAVMGCQVPEGMDGFRFVSIGPVCVSRRLRVFPLIGTLDDEAVARGLAAASNQQPR